MLLLLLLVAFIGCAVGYKNTSNVWLVEVMEKTNPVALGQSLGLDYLHQMPSVAGRTIYAYRRLRGGSRGYEISELADEHPAIIWHERQKPIQRFKRRVSSLGRPIADPLFVSGQWHMHDTYLAMDSVFLGHRGNNAIIAIVDDGLQWRHPDLTDNYIAAASHDFNGDGSDPSPSAGDGHGTSAGGVAAASSNNVCGVGTCPDCQVAGIRLIAGPSTDYMEAMALSHAKDTVAVYSNSWGPTDDGRTMEGPGRVTLAAFEYNAEHGRGGKGSIYVWAGGNGAAAKDDGNYDGYANSRFTIAVGAIAHDGRRSYYSEPCACLMVVAPSSGSDKNYGITTTDLMGRDGYSAGECTNSFGGTSSAAPAVAGVLGLLLGSRPDLKRRDVLNLLAITSNKTLWGNDWTPRNAHGVSHSHEYGWGMVNPAGLLAVALSPSFQPLSEELICSSGRFAVNTRLFDGLGKPSSFPMELPNIHCATGNLDVVEYVEVRLWLNHPRRGDVAVSLKDPHGVTSQLASPRNDNNAGYPAATGWLFGSARHWGQTFAGKWTLSVEDKTANGRIGTLAAFEVIVRGHKLPSTAGRLRK